MPVGIIPDDNEKFSLVEVQSDSVRLVVFLIIDVHATTSDGESRAFLELHSSASLLDRRRFISLAAGIRGR